MGILDLMNGIEAAGDRGRQRGQQTALGRLYSQAATAPREQRTGLLAQMGAISPQAAFDAESHFGKMDDSARKQLGQYAAAFSALPPEQKAAAYPQLAEMGRSLGLPVPQGGYQQGYDAGIAQLGQALGGTGATSEVQTFNTFAKDLSPVDAAKARRIQLGLDPRAVGAAAKSLTLDINGVPTTLTFDPVTGGYMPAVIGGGATQPQAPAALSAGGDVFAGLAQAVPGLTVTSAQRSPEHNRDVGGVPNSYHLTGQARDILPPNAQQAPAVRQWAAQNGMEVIPEGDHWHIEPRPGSPIIGRTKEAEAAAVAQSEGQVKLDQLPEQGRIEADNARIKKQAELQAQRESDRIENAPKARAALQGARNAASSVDRAINQALPNVNVWTAGFAGVPLAKLPGSAAADLRAAIDTVEANLAFDRLQQMRQSSPTGGALGSVSERELTLLGATLASLKQSQSPKQLAENLRFVQQQYKKVLDQMEADYQTDYGTQQQSSPNVIRYDAKGNRI